MMKTIKYLACCCFIIILVLGLSSCQAKWTVTFNTDGGSPIPSQQVNDGARIQKPDPPIKEGYTFVRWTCFDEPWSFVENAVTENLELEAVWSANNYTINLLDGSKRNQIRVTFDKPYSLTAPAKEGYTFGGYYLDGQPFELSGTYRYSHNIELTAEWILNTYTATFVSFGQEVARVNFTIEDKEIQTPNTYKYGYPVAWHYLIEAHNMTIYSDTIYFGKYEQDNDTDKKEKIEWYILDESDGKIFLLSKCALDCIKYKEDNKGTTWETSDARKWLNENFFESAFTDTEKKYIQTTTVIPDKSIEKDLNFGNVTNDKIFLLSKAEVEKYLKDIDRKLCKVTEYAVKNKAYKNYVTNDTMWMLRSVGWDNGRIFVVSDFQGEYYSLAEVGMLMYSVRPAMWVKINN